MTYRELLAKLMTLPDDVLNQPAQVFQYDPPNHDGPYELRPVYAAGTVGEMMGADERVICNRDGGDNRDSFILLADLCGFSADGDWYYTLDLETGKGVGNKSGKVVDIFGTGEGV